MARAAITGYRVLNQDEMDLINEGKELGIMIEGYLAKVEKYHGLGAKIDQRWLEKGRMELQNGLMSVVRSIARPTTF